MCQLRLFQFNTIRRLSTLRLPLTFYQVPYDEQYESRDFIRIKGCINYDNDNDKNDNKKDTKS